LKSLSNKLQLFFIHRHFKLQEDIQLKIGNLKQYPETPASQANLPKLAITKFNGTYADTNHQNVAKSPHQQIKKNFWPQRSFALAITNQQNAKVPQHVKPVVNGIILQSAVCQRK